MQLTFDFQESWQELEFVLLCRDRICKLLAIVEGLEERLETVVRHRHGEYYQPKYMGGVSPLLQ
jgi:hypothetical protein